jgi:hypothetical protein
LGKRFVDEKLRENKMPRKKGTDQKEKSVYFYVAEDVYDKVIEVSEKEAISVTEIANNALRQYLKIEKPKKQKEPK